MHRFAVLMTLLLQTMLEQTYAQELSLGRTMAWSAYNLGTTGYNQAVAIGKVLKDHYDVNLRGYFSLRMINGVRCPCAWS
jgi:hypothetical protein